MTIPNSSVEVEITGPLTPDRAARIRNVVSTWRSEGQLDRYLINFTTEDLRARRIDLRARTTNGQPEMVVKHGEWGSGKRVETGVQVKPGEFEHLVAAIVGLGFTAAVGGRRIISRFSNGEIELSIIEVPNYSLFYEAERIVPAGSEDSAMVELTRWAASHGLAVYTKEQYLGFIADLDAHANDILDFSDQRSWETIRRQTTSS